jgi:hypothetical protein
MQKQFDKLVLVRLRDTGTEQGLFIFYLGGGVVDFLTGIGTDFRPGW